MKRSNLAFLALLVSQIAVVAALVITSHRLPLRVASHFNSAGTPDGWMSRAAYLWSMFGIMLAITLLLIGTFYSIRFFPCSTINLPEKEYWLAPDRRNKTFDAIFRAGVWLATFQTVFFLGMHLLVVAANASQPVMLSSHVWFLLAGFLLVVMAWSIVLIQRFRRTTEV
jgi:uncharacterized membrane protein